MLGYLSPDEFLVEICMFTMFSERTYSQTHSRTDTPENSMPPAVHRKFSVSDT